MENTASWAWKWKPPGIYGRSRGVRGESADYLHRFRSYSARMNRRLRLESVRRRSNDIVKIALESVLLGDKE